MSHVVSLELEQRFDGVTAIHLLQYLEGGTEIKSVLRKIHNAWRTTAVS